MLMTSLKNAVGSAVRHRVRTIKKIVSYRTNPPRMISGFLRNKNGQPIRNLRCSNTVYLYSREKVTIGENVFISHFTIIDGTGGVDIGEGCQIGPWVGIFTHSSAVAIRLYGRHYREVPENEKAAYMIRPVKIGKYTCIGPRVTIMPGVTIGKGCIIYPGTTVWRDIPDYSIVTGDPPSIIGDTRRLDSRYTRRDPVLNQWYSDWSDQQL